MKKPKIILIVILAIIIIWFLFFANFQTISIDKDTYSVGEQITGNYSYFKLFGCDSPAGLSLYFESSGSWEYIYMLPESFEPVVCVNGVPETPVMREGYFSCGIPIIINQDYTIDSLIYEKKSEKEVCNFEDSERFRRFADLPEAKEPITSYVKKQAPAGTYKVKLGSAEKVFEIK